MIESGSWDDNIKIYIFSATILAFKVRNSWVYLVIAELKLILHEVSISLDRIFSY